MRREAAAAALLLVLIMPLPATAAAPDAREQVERRLMCPCGCTDLTVRACTCGTADAMRVEITGSLSGGKTVEQVVDAFVERYGARIRSAPTTAGFDLVAWVMPFAAILAAAAALVWTVRRWRARAAAHVPVHSAPAAPMTAAEQRLLDRVRRDIEDRY